MTRLFVCSWLIFSVMACSVEARIRRGHQSYTTSSQARAAGNYGGEVSSAQGVANIMARIGRVGHFGGNRGYEGCGSGSTPHQAEMNCCYRRQMSPKEVGYAQAANGTWYCCCRY